MGSSISLWCQSWNAHRPERWEQIVYAHHMYFEFGPVNGQVHDVECKLVHPGSSNLADYPIYSFPVPGMDEYEVKSRLELRLYNAQGMTVARFKLRSNDIWGLLVQEHERDEASFYIKGKYMRALFQEDGDIRLMDADEGWPLDYTQGQMEVEFTLTSDGYKVRNVTLHHKELYALVERKPVV